MPNNKFKPLEVHFIHFWKFWFFPIFWWFFPPWAWWIIYITSNPFSKVFNINSVKVSYSCMPNMGQIISKQNKQKINLQDDKQKVTKECSCQDPSKCPVEGKCLTKGVIYQAIVKQTLSGHEESYCGLTDSSFKLRFDGHNNSFRHEKYKTKTTLSSHIWDLKSKHIDFELSWRILSKARSYSPSNKICNLCNREAYFIIYKSNLGTLNKRNELMNTCRHRLKFKLSNQDKTFTHQN